MDEEPSKKVITVYSSTLEPYSDMLKNLLKFHDFPFENIDVTNKPERIVDLIRLSGQASTPVMMVGSEVYIGFDRELMKHVLGVDAKNSHEKQPLEDSKTEN